MPSCLWDETNRLMDGCLGWLIATADGECTTRWSSSISRRSLTHLFSGLAVHQAVTTNQYSPPKPLPPVARRLSFAIAHLRPPACAQPQQRRRKLGRESFQQFWPGPYLPAASLFSSNPSHLIPSVHPSTTSTQPPRLIIPDHPKAQKNT